MKATDPTAQQPTPQHERGGADLPQRFPVPASRPHPEDRPLPRRTPGASL